MNLLAANEASPALLAILFVTVLAFGGGVTVFFKCLKRCPSNRLLVVFGQGIAGGAHVQHGGAKMVWPLIQDYAYITLEPYTVEFPDFGVFSRESAKVVIKGNVLVAVSTKHDHMALAAERLLGLDERAISSLASDEAGAALRELAAQLSVEMMFKDTEKFAAELQLVLDERLRKFGMEVITTRVQEITDNAGIIEGFNREAARRAYALAKEEVEFMERREKEEAEFKARRALEEAEFKERLRRQEEVRNGPSPAGPSPDVLKEDPGSALKNM